MGRDRADSAVDGYRDLGGFGGRIHRDRYLGVWIPPVEHSAWTVGGEGN